jgi:hypothetical protein
VVQEDRVRLSAATAIAALVASAASVAAVAAGPPTPLSSAPSSSSSSGLKANPCKGVKNCVTVGGPWVAVPASGEVDFLLECPKRSGTIGGIDALSSSADVRVEWDGNIGSPVRPGTSTSFLAYFRAYSASGRAGVYQPYIGCIPSPKVNPRSTVSARVTRPGKDNVDRWQTTIDAKPGASQSVTRSCGKKGEHLLGGWNSVVFGATDAPSPALASKVHVTLTISKVAVVASIHTDAGMPSVAQAKVQVGAVCAK